MIINPIRLIRAMRTPPCRICKHCTGFEYGKYPFCDSDGYLERIERMTGIRYKRAEVTVVRGGRYCHYLPVDTEKQGTVK